MLYDDSPMVYPVLTPADMRRTEQKAFDCGVPSLLLMEHAAMAVVEELEEALGGDCRGKNVLFLCGKGNNGGDGLAAARLFNMRGGIAAVWLCGAPQTENAKINLKWLEATNARVMNLEKLPEDQLPFMSKEWDRVYDGCVDALLGTGSRGAPDGLLSRVISSLPLHGPVIAVDIPSGIDGTTGDTPGAFVRANATVTFHAPKPGLYLTREREAVGKIVVADIGLQGMDLPCDDLHLNCQVMTAKALRRLPKRSLNAHKGDCGRVLIYAGSPGMAGAAAMCAQAAITAGAGLTTIACGREILPILQTLVPGAMCVDTMDAIRQPPVYDVLAVGCGLGQSEETWANILKLWNPEKPSVWDADGLNLLAKHPITLGNNAVITPHIGEAARLLKVDAAEILQDRLAAARQLAEIFGCTAVLKSDVSVICDVRDRRPRYFLNAVGSPALAKGGSGDALTGILAVLLQGRNPADAAALACLWHGVAGVMGARMYGERELTTQQLIGCLFVAEQAWEK